MNELTLLLKVICFTLAFYYGVYWIFFLASLGWHHGKSKVRHHVITSTQVNLGESFAELIKAINRMKD